MYTIAMAYAGTGNNQAIRKLLHVAVSFFFQNIVTRNIKAVKESYRPTLQMIEHQIA